MDRYIAGSLKNWASQQQPPAEMRERLLFLAKTSADALIEPAAYYYEERPAQPVEKLGPRTAGHPENIAWMYLFQMPMPALRMI
jgi:hypothetical protein